MRIAQRLSRRLKRRQNQRELYGKPCYAGHNGHRRLVEETIQPPWHAEAQCIGTTTFAHKLSDDE